MGKSKKKGKQTDEFYEQLVKAKTDDAPAAGWHTGPVSDMVVDSAAAATAAEPAPEAAASTSGKGKRKKQDGMQLDQPATVGSFKRAPGKKRLLGIASASLKRGQRTKAQRLRKVDKLEKAMARVDKVGVRVAGEQTNKVRKLGLKHMY